MSKLESAPFPAILMSMTTILRLYDVVKLLLLGRMRQDALY
jgi:hypothetical protein